MLYKKPAVKNTLSDLIFIGLAITLLGFLVVFLAMILNGKASNGGEGKAQMKGGGVIMIGPIPIIFGSDAKWTSIAIVLAIVLIAVMLFSGVLVRQ